MRGAAFKREKASAFSLLKVSRPNPAPAGGGVGAGLVFEALPQKPAPHVIGKLVFYSEGKRKDLRINHCVRRIAGTDAIPYYKFGFSLLNYSAL